MKHTEAILNSMTAQEVFDKVARHLLTQNKACGVWTRNHFSCKYRKADKDGKMYMCAAGCLIEDDDYSPELEGNNWRVLVQKGKINTIHDPLIEDLQRLHDQTPVEYWKSELINIAVMHSLNAKVINEL